MHRFLSSHSARLALVHFVGIASVMLLVSGCTENDARNENAKAPASSFRQAGTNQSPGTKVRHPNRKGSETNVSADFGIPGGIPGGALVPVASYSGLRQGANVGTVLTNALLDKGIVPQAFGSRGITIRVGQGRSDEARRIIRAAILKYRLDAVLLDDSGCMCLSAGAGNRTSKALGKTGME